MVAVQLTPDEVVQSSVKSLGFDEGLADLETPEVVVEAIRRASSFMCPTSPRRLVQAVEEVMRGLVPSELSDDDEASVSALLEAVTAYGDLVEVPLEDESGISRRVVFLGPPSYVTVSSTIVLLVGFTK